ncbi:MAG: hypothetical protein HYY26_05070 [Acidobacteria bacterium]|nr:hypothetical protein [Acidobacteriota bacterium]
MPKATWERRGQALGRELGRAVARLEREARRAARRGRRMQQTARQQSIKWMRRAARVLNMAALELEKSTAASRRRPRRPKPAQ